MLKKLPSGLPAGVIQELKAVVGADHVSEEMGARFAYCTDTFWVSQRWLESGFVPPVPDVVVQPGSAQEVAALLLIASNHGVPVVPWGGGSGSQGGAICLYGGIVMDLKRLNRVIDIDAVSLAVTAQAGINGRTLEWEINKANLTLAHYPASQNCATLGGYLAPRGSGVLSTKYGKAEDLVLSLEVALPTGELVRMPRVPNHASGPQLMSLFVGSEGTLGVITEATMRLDPFPEVRRFRSFVFPTIDEGLEAGRQIMTSRLRPMVLRLYDEASSQAVINRVLGEAVEGAYMVMGFDGFAEIAEAEEARAISICRSAGGRDLGSEPGNRWWAHRYDFYYPPFHLHQPALYGTTDTVARYCDIAALYRAKKRLIEEEFAEWNATYIAHFSHWFAWGVMVYDRFVVRQPPEEPQAAVRLHNRIWDAAVRTNLAHGGVVNEHHGVGVKLGRLMPEFLGAGWPILQGVKDMLDPRGIMNPGKQGLRVPEHLRVVAGSMDMGER